MRIFLDFGFGYLKAINEQGKEVIFPSVAGELVESSFGLDSSNQLSITTEDGSWLFGDDARLQSVSASHSQDSKWILSDQYKAGILLAISEISKSISLKVELMLALPYQDFNDKELVNALIDKLRRKHTINRSFYQHIDISFNDRFSVVPQNAATMLSHVLNDNGKFTLSSDRNRYPLASVNIGSQTLEQSTVIFEHVGNRFKWTGIEAQSKTETLGTYVLTRLIRQLLQNKVGRIRLSDHDIFDAIRSGKIYSGSKELPLNGLLNKPLDQYIKLITDNCSNTWNDQPPVMKDELYGLIVSGGGAYLVSDGLRKWHDQIWVSDNPQWDVCQGMRKFRRLING